MRLTLSTSPVWVHRKSDCRLQAARSVPTMGQFAPVTFIKQSFKAFHTTGAIAPSSPFAAKAMVRSLPRRAEDIPDDFKVLEVGAGTGPFSAVIAKRMKGRGHFHI